MEFKPDAAPEQIHRRSIYTFWKRTAPPPQMTTFDAPSREFCSVRRERTNTPLQALVLMNEEQFFAAAKHLAGNLLKTPGLTAEQRIRQAYETITSHQAGDVTVSELRDTLAEFRALYAGDAELRQALVGTEGNESAQAETAAWTILVHALLNLDATKTRE